MEAKKQVTPLQMYCSAMLPPSGKLNYSFTQSTGHLPAYYNHLPTDEGFYKRPGRDYVFSDPSSLWNFGHGLSYTKFEYLSASTDKNSYDFDKDNDATEVKVDGRRNIAVKLL